MNGLSQRERIVLSVLISLSFFVFLFMVLQLAYYERYIPVEPFFKPEVAPMEDPLELSKEDVFIDQNQGDVKNYSRNQNDTRESSNSDFNQNTPSGDPFERAKQYEQELFEESGGKKEREKILKDHDQKKQNKPKSDANTTPNGNNNNGESKQFNGDVMVEWRLDGRTAFENNNWWVRNPGYTCGYGASGKVVIKISVDQSGKVLQAVYDANASSGANPCMIEQAQLYAKKSKFNYMESAKQQAGVIIYRFISQ